MSSRPDFETAVLPHLDAAYNLARWLLRNDASAEDAVQEAVIRAFRYFDSLRGADARPWLLGIVRNTCFTQLERQKQAPELRPFDDEQVEASFEGLFAQHAADPAVMAQQGDTRRLVDAALRALPPPLREVVVLREFEDLDYAQIARIIDAPVGTVMSRLSRAREKLRAALTSLERKH